MTREDNRHIIESLQPLLENALKAIKKTDAKRISIHVSQDHGDYGSLTVGDYEIVHLDGRTRLEYRPSCLDEWETEKDLPSGNSEDPGK